jgi:hypothetical protein
LTTDNGIHATCYQQQQQHISQTAKKKAKKYRKKFPKSEHNRKKTSASNYEAFRLERLSPIDKYTQEEQTVLDRIE